MKLDNVIDMSIHARELKTLTEKFYFMWFFDFDMWDVSEPIKFALLGGWLGMME
jgi:hypothetical protein